MANPIIARLLPIVQPPADAVIVVEQEWRKNRYRKNSRVARLGDTAWIELTCGLWAILDLVDLPLVSNQVWYAHFADQTAYACRNPSEEQPERRMHRLLLAAAKDQTTDHVDHNGLNNRRINIRLCSVAENNRNIRATRNVIGLKGVSKHGRMYRAQITFDGKYHLIGAFKTPQEAHEAYCEAAKRLHGKFANFG